ncbi:MAG: hypothetical protein JXP73_05165 [Deltaproteobacteria bacterium]|nr:hypothetical protein [Deltaproteobacteria bacterium]
MRIFKFWTRIEGTLTVGGRPQPAHAYGGSNVSLEEAERDARRRLEGVARRIAGQGPGDDGYEADIREEVLAQIDERNVVTRNRYGAAVLNSSELLFIDIDEPRLGFWDVFRPRPTGDAKKARIVAQAKKLFAGDPALRGLGLRLYETRNGVRAIVTGRAFDAKARSTRKLLRRFHADWLYGRLCERQGCFRARLTPKPSRIKCRKYAFAFPRLDDVQEAEHRAWVAAYDQARARFATCRLVCSLGGVFELLHPVVAWHDRETGATSSLELA